MPNPAGFRMSRIRHCVECPKCLTRYLIAFSPYGNGSYLVPTVYGSSNEYTLYCSCCVPRAVSRWRWNEMKTCDVTKAAYERGYGTPEEILAAATRLWPIDISGSVEEATQKGGRPR